MAVTVPEKFGRDGEPRSAMNKIRKLRGNWASVASTPQLYTQPIELSGEHNSINLNINPPAYRYAIFSSMSNKLHKR